jgi:AraC-like DNA-binding protein
MLFYFYFVIIVFSFITQIEVFFTLNRYSYLKKPLLLVLFTISIRYLLFLMDVNIIKFLWLYYLLGSFLVILSFLIFCIILDTKLTRKYLLIFSVTVVSFFFIVGYEHFIKLLFPQFHFDESNLVMIFRYFIFPFTALINFNFFKALYQKLIIKISSDNIHSQQIRRWITIYISIFFFGLFSFILKFYQLISFYHLQIFLSFLHFIIVLLILFRPLFLYKANLQISLGSFFSKKVIHNVSKKHFEHLFNTKMYFLNRNSSSDEFASQLNVSNDELFRFVQQLYKLSFNDLVNKNRIDYFVSLVNSNKFNNETIDFLARKSGFKSRDHLYKPFKKFHGGNPSDFIRSVSEIN